MRWDEVNLTNTVLAKGPWLSDPHLHLTRPTAGPQTPRGWGRRGLAELRWGEVNRREVTPGTQRRKRKVERGMVDG